MRITKLLCVSFLAVTTWISVVHAEDLPPLYPVGSGFFVNKGYVVTHSNNLRHCSQIYLYGAVEGVEAVLASDIRKNRLALLYTEESPEVAAVFRSDSLPLRLGNPLVLFGFRLNPEGYSIMMPRKAQVVGESVFQDKSKAVLFDSVSMLNINGSPLLDATGNVVGVVSAKPKPIFLPSGMLAPKTPDYASFAINASAVRQLLQEYRIPFLEADSSFYYEPDVIASKARKYIVHIRCSYEGR